MDMVSRGEVWLATLDPTVGVEIRKTRPALVVSPDDLNARLPIVTIVPLTSGNRPARFRVPVNFKGRPGLILAEQLRSVDRSRLVKRLGQVDEAVLLQTLAVLRHLFSP